MSTIARDKQGRPQTGGSPRHGREPSRHRQTDGDEPTTAWWWVRTIVSWGLLLLMIAALAVMVIIPRLTGSQAYTVLTGSMEPNYPPGTLIVVKPTPAEDLNVGDVITFQPVSGDPSVVTHRIDGIYFNGAGERQIFTRGDANDVVDSWALVPDQIRGRLLYSVPELGRVNSVINGQSRSILLTVVVIGLGTYAVVMVASGLRERRRDKSVSAGESPAQKAGPAGEVFERPDPEHSSEAKTHDPASHSKTE